MITHTRVLGPVFRSRDRYCISQLPIAMFDCRLPRIVAQNGAR